MREVVAEANSPRKVKVATSLRFLHEVLGLEHLHYGLWDGEPRTRDGLHAAQERYAEELAAWIPEGVRTILDVGAGTGALSARLAGRGYEVEGLSPDPYQQEIYERRTGRPFHLCRFQELAADRRWDLVLMSESAQYVWLSSLFPAVRRHLEPGGWLLVADYFARDGVEERVSGHPRGAMLREAARHGLELEREEDLTERTLPTLELAVEWWDRYVDPSLEIARGALGQRSPRLFGLGRRIFGRKIGRELEKARRTIDPADFRRTRTYERMLFRDAGAPAVAD